MDSVKRLLEQKLLEMTGELNDINEKLDSNLKQNEYLKNRSNDVLKLISEIEGALELLERDDSDGEIQEQ